MKAQLFTFLVLFTSLVQAQTSTRQDHYYRFAVSNSHTAKPFSSFSSLFYKDFHPGAEFGFGKNLKSIKKHQWLLEITMSYLFHRWVQHNFALSVNGGYRRFIGPTWGGTVKLGGGYQLSIPTGKLYSISENGLKEKGHVPRSQFISSLGFGADKKINTKGTRVFMEYQQKLQTPFIKEYVPLLPYNNLLLGITIPVQ